MHRRRSLAAVASCLGLAACLQGQAGGSPPPANELACPGSGAAPATTGTSAIPACTCPSGPADTLDAGGVALDAAAPPAGDAALIVSDGAITAATLVALLGPPARSDPNPVLCPGTLSCQSFDGLPACMAQGALSPPGCQTNADCIAAGMPGVACVTLSIDIAGAVSLPLPVCLELCNSP